MTLTAELEEFAAKSAEMIPPEAMAIMRKATEDLAASGLVDRALGVGDKAPNFSLPNSRDEITSSSNFLGKGPLVVIFYRGQWCPYCNLELRAYQQAYAEITGLGAQVVAISPELPDLTLSTHEKNQLSFDILSDLRSRVSDAFGLTFRLPDALVEIYNGFGINLPKDHGEDDWRLPVPGAFVIDMDKTIALAHVDTDYSKRLDPVDVIATLKDLKARKQV